MPTALIDVVGTFFSLEPLRSRLTALGAPDHTLEHWFSESMRDYLALSHAGTYVPLAEVLEATLPRTLAMIGKGSQDPSRHELVIRGLRVLNPAEGAKEATEILTRSGFRLVALTNGSREHAEALLERAGLKDRFAAVLSADEAQSSKPAGDLYELARPHLLGEPWLISSHAWDIHGAHQAGFKTAWLSKKEKLWPQVFASPDLEVPDLLTCARVLGEAASAALAAPSVSSGAVAVA